MSENTIKWRKIPRKDEWVAKSGGGFYCYKYRVSKMTYGAYLAGFLMFNNVPIEDGFGRGYASVEMAKDGAILHFSNRKQFFETWGKTNLIDP